MTTDKLPLDIHGNPLVVGGWYWAREEWGGLIGVGEIVNGLAGELFWVVVDYETTIEGKQFAPAVPPDFTKGEPDEPDETELKPQTLADIKQLLPNAPPWHLASALLDFNGKMTTTETTLEALRDLVVEIGGPLQASFFQNAIAERRQRHNRFIEDLMSGKLDDIADDNPCNVDPNAQPAKPEQRPFLDAEEGFENCQQKLMQDGKSYPRTCQICGLGPCHWFGKDDKRTIGCKIL